jgi:hypothetical protein
VRFDTEVDHVALSPVQTLFPGWAAAANQTKLHGTEAFAFARQALDTPDPAAKLDLAVRAYNSFDHAITASRRLPMGWLTGGDVGKYYLGYDAAKTAATLLIGSGVIPGARELMGKSEITAAREYFHRSVDGYASGGTSRYNRALSNDFLNASIEDATNGLFMLRGSDVAQPLLSSLAGTRAAIAARRQLDAGQIKQIDELFARAGSTLDAAVASAAANAKPADPMLLAQTDAAMAAAIGAPAPSK